MAAAWCLSHDNHVEGLRMVAAYQQVSSVTVPTLPRAPRQSEHGVVRLPVLTHLI